VPGVGPTRPGLPEPPAQPDKPVVSAKRNTQAAAKAQARRRTRIDIAKAKISASAKSVWMKTRSRSNLPGYQTGVSIKPFDAAVVVTVVMTVTGASRLKDAGEGVQLDAGMGLLQETVTTPLNPPEGARDRGNVADWPAETVAEEEAPGGTEMMMSVPSPERVMDCGLAGALSVIVIAPARPPVVVGAKVTEIVHVGGGLLLELGATPLVQVSVSAKSPLALMLTKLSVALPVLVTVTTCGLLVVPTI